MTDKDVVHSDRPHGELSSSWAPVWVNCHGAYALIKSLGHIPPTEKMMRGTYVHEVCDKILTNFLAFKEDGAFREPIVADAEALERAQEWVDIIWKEVLEESLTGKAYDIEALITISKEMGMFTYADFLALWTDDRGKRKAYVVDYKNGYSIVGAKGNYQLAFCGVAARCEVRKMGKDLDYVDVAIFQPNSPDEKPWKTARFTAKQLDVWEEKFLKAGHEILVKKSTKLKKGKWCGNCKARGICPEYGKKLERDSQIKLLDTKDSFTLPEVEKLPAEQRGLIAKHADVLIDFIKEVKKSVLRDLMQGVEYKDLKAIQGSGRRAWIKDEEAINKTFAHYLSNVEVDFLYTQKLNNFGAVEKQLIKLIGKKDTDIIMAQVTQKSPGSLKLVDIDDPRPPAKNLLSLLDDEE